MAKEWTATPSPDETKRNRFTPGIRIKLAVSLLALSFAIIAAVSAAVTGITESAVRRDLVQRGVAVSRVVALSAGYSFLSGDTLALHRLTSETKGSSPDIEYVAVLDKKGTIVSHSCIQERGGQFCAVPFVSDEGRHSDTQVAQVTRDGRDMIEFTTPVLFAGQRVGTVSLGLSKESLLRSQQSVRRSILMAASFFLALALGGTLILASIVTTPVKRLASGVSELADGVSFNPIPARGGDELGELTRNFNRMAKTILAQQDRLTRYAGDLEEAYISLVRVIAASIDARDPYTLGHSTRVSRLAREVGKRLGFSEEENGHLEKACLFHDVGKIRTPDYILLKEHRLTPEEHTVMKNHPADGAEILGMAPSLHRYMQVVLSHHEWYNGMGYPEGRRGHEVPIHAQIIALADAYDAMTSTRPYRKALTPQAAIEEILRWRGRQFSPELTDVFIRTIADTTPATDIRVQSAP